MVQDFSPQLVGDKGQPDVPAIDNQQLVKNIKLEIDRSRKRKGVFSKEWPRFYSIYAGKHWDRARPEWMSEPVINFTFSTIETILPILTDNRPKINIVPKEPDDLDIAKVLSHVVESVWESNDMDITLPKVMKNTLIFGNGFVKVDWDPNARDGLGDIRVVGVDPENILVDPDGTDDDNIRWMAHVQNIHKDHIAQNPLWAPFASQVNSGRGFDPKFTVERNVSSQISRGTSTKFFMGDTTGSESFLMSGNSGMPSGSQAGEQGNLVTLIEYWSKRTLPEGGFVIWKTVVANDVVLEDGPTPFSHNRFPFVHFVDYPVGWNYWASGEVQQVESLQLEINKRRGLMLDIMKFTASPMLVVDPTGGVDYETLVTRPGMIIPAIGGPGSVGWLSPPSMPGSLFAMNDRDKADFDDILGNVDVLQGKRPVGIEAAAAIEALTEAANTRMRLKVRYMEASLRHIGQLIVSMIQQFYQTERIVRVAGRDADSLLDEELDFLRVNEVQPGPDGSVQINNPIPPDAEFDVKIGAGSTLPVSRASRFTQALQLFQAGAIDQIELLKHADWPRFEEVIARMRQEQQQQLAAALAQEGATGGE